MEPDLLLNKLHAFVSAATGVELSDQDIVQRALRLLWQHRDLLLRQLVDEAVRALQKRRDDPV